MRALISGIAGFAGSHLAEHLLESGDQVLGCSLHGKWPADVPSSVAGHVDIFSWDIGRPASASIRRRILEFSPDAIYHLAAISVPGVCGMDQPTARAGAVNVDGTQALLACAAQLPQTPRFLLASTCYVYAPVSFDRPVVDEDAPLGPQRGYGKSKLAAEQLVAAAGREGTIEPVIARAFQHSGPRQSAQMILPDWASQLAAPGNHPLRVICRDTYLDLSDVRDVVHAYRALVVDGNPQTVYNVGSGICRRSGDLLELLLEIAGGRREVVELEPGRRQHPVADVSRLVSHTNWKARIDIRQTLEDIFAYWQQRNSSS